MAVLSNTMLQGTSAVSDDSYELKNSLKLSPSDEIGNQYLSKRNFLGDSRRFTIAFWFKLNDMFSDIELFGCTKFFMQYRPTVGAGGELYFRFTTSADMDLEFSRSLRDPAAWYHLTLAVDTDNDKERERVRAFLNGELMRPEDPVVVTGDYPGHGSDCRWHNNGLTTDPRLGSGPNNQTGGFQVADFYSIDGRVLSPAAFGAFDTFGQWQPKEFKLPQPNQNTTWSAGGNWNASSGTLSDLIKVFDGSDDTGLGSSDAGATFTFTPPTPLECRCSVEVTQGGFDGWYQLNAGEDDETEKRQTVANQGWNWFPAPSSGTLKNIRMYCASGNTLNTRAIKVDGVMLVDGRTDKETLADNINDGKLWSDGSSYPSGGYGYETFDGTSKNNSSGVFDTSYDTITKHSITVNDRIRFHTNTGSGGGTERVKDGNGNEYQLHDSNQEGWKIMYNGDSQSGTPYTGTLAGPIYIKKDVGSSHVSALEVDGQVLIDNWFDNSVHFKFEDSARSGRNYLAADVTTATGALPILNTTDDYGHVKGSGYRADSSAGTTDGTGLVLAIPGESDYVDYHHQINTGSSQATIAGHSSAGTVIQGDLEPKFYGNKHIWFPNGASGDYLKSQNANSDYTFGTSPFTVEGWFYVENTSDNPGLFQFTTHDEPTTTYTEGFAVSHHGNKIQVLIGNDAGNTETIEATIGNTGGYLTDKRWYHVAITRPSTNVWKIYVNGRCVKETTITNAITISSTFVVIGIAKNAAGALQGAVCDFRVYKGVTKYTSNFTVPDSADWVNKPQRGLSESNGALSYWNTVRDDGLTKKEAVDTVRTDANSGNFSLVLPGDALVDKSGNNFTVSQSNAGSVTNVTNDYVFYGTSMYFDGAGGLEVADDADFDFGSGNFTIEFWIKPYAMTIPQCDLICQRESGQAGAISVITSGTGVQWYMGSNGSAWDIVGGNGCATIGPHKWTHVALVRNGNTFKSYEDVVEKFSTTNSGTVHNNSANFCVGTFLGGGNFKGWMQDVRVYKGVAKYTSDFNVPQTSLAFNATDFTTDTPSNNYATLNPLSYKIGDGGAGDRDFDLDTSSNKMKFGNLGLDAGTSDNINSYSTIEVRDKCYYEVEVMYKNVNGLVGTGPGNYNAVIGYGDGAYVTYRENGTVIKYPGNTTLASGKPTLSIGDVLGVGIDQTNVIFYVNGTLVDTYAHGLTETIFVAAMSYNNGHRADLRWNFGQREFKYTNAGTNRPDATYVDLCTNNLPDLFSGDNKNLPSKYFDMITYVGNNGTRVLAPGFGPDFTILKSYDTAWQWNLFDRIRGDDKVLTTGGNDADTTKTDQVTFNTNDITIDEGNNEMNNQDDLYLTMHWDAGTTAATPSTQGTINPSDQWVNNTAGFSITKYTGNNTASQSIGHGLNAVPEFIIIKKLNAAADWHAGHVGIGWEHHFYFGGANSIGNSVQQDDANVWSDTAPTNTVWYTGANGSVNGNGDTHIAYCWTSIPGFSKFGVYDANGDDEGPFVHCGFRPALIYVKAVNVAGQGFYVFCDPMDDTWDDGIKESERPFNRKERRMGFHGNWDSSLYAGNYHDTLSNGFKMRENYVEMNSTTAGSKYCYCAWAKHPFKLARGE